MLKKDTTTVASSNPKISTKRGVGFGDLRITHGWTKDLWFTFEAFRS